MDEGKYSTREVNNRFRKILEEMRIDFTEAYFFGSRARNNAHQDSDWDYLIVVNHELNGKERRNLSARLNIRFHQIVPDQAVDIIIKSKKDFEAGKNILNYISYEAFHSGVPL